MAEVFFSVRKHGGPEPFLGDVGHAPHVLGVVAFIAGLQQPDGSFASDQWGEAFSLNSWCSFPEKGTRMLSGKMMWLVVVLVCLGFRENRNGFQGSFAFEAQNLWNRAGRRKVRYPVNALT